MSSLGAFAAALAAGDEEGALALWRRGRGDLRLAFDHEPPFVGALRVDPPLPFSSLSARLRSWEMIDRVTEPADDEHARRAAAALLQLLTCPATLADALLVRVDRSGHATMIVHLARATWRTLGARWAEAPGLAAHEARVRALRPRLAGP